MSRHQQRPLWVFFCYFAVRCNENPTQRLGNKSGMSFCWTRDQWCRHVAFEWLILSFFLSFFFSLCFPSPTADLMGYNVRLTVPPSVTLNQQLIGAPIGSTVSLDCAIESSPAALHFWSRSDGTVLHEASKYVMQSSSSTGPVIVPTMAASPTTWPSFRTQVKFWKIWNYPFHTISIHIKSISFAWLSLTSLHETTELTVAWLKIRLEKPMESSLSTVSPEQYFSIYDLMTLDRCMFIDSNGWIEGRKLKSRKKSSHWGSIWIRRVARHWK